MKHITDFTIITNQRETDEFVVLTLQHPGELPSMVPGQFAEVRVDGAENAFLRRPLSIHDVDYSNNTIKLLIQEVGEGTRVLAKLKSGDQLNLVYPLGTGYSLPKSNRVLLVGGGCGVAPLLFLGRHFVENGIRPKFLIGGRTAATLIRLDAYEQLGDVYVTTEDGSAGHKGFVIHHPIMKTETPEFDHIYTCGPDAMMKVLAKYAGSRGITCQVSLENHMACGFGACLCCVTPTVDGHKCTCVDGPVFDSKYLKWEI
ncbi:dihydroorotate dehydrogenase electron transfer subunit [Alkalitalea saponilacus]|uniref:Dihydroorotate dehydrogenase B (NAD(+)), electron transfer subunit n=1 Tax=Alkalitalea saponilacus TaxID=889453 RepID=A0A1T5DBD9_9BACT|nr:dihydroorotate dehydrogenase electron transfer subunit [Alkalitalea saponilacus]ASB50650.1 dihydroorotate dehydrogenase electron transfer subunit [Alkalitalea saponilacus]SKB68989.1 dihydroorotate dehydrogenase electron transfer subunit [Alkalitalea saponilacus]